MGRGQSGIMESPMKHKPDQRYTRESGYGDRARSHQELKDAEYRKPTGKDGTYLKERI